MQLFHFASVRVAAMVGLGLLIVCGSASTLKTEEQPVSIVAARIAGHIHPSVCRTKDGTLVVVYKGANVLMRARSTDGGQIWEKPVVIATSAKRPKVIRKVKKFEVYPGTADVLPDDRVLVTWNWTCFMPREPACLLLLRLQSESSVSNSGTPHPQWQRCLDDHTAGIRVEFPGTAL